MNAPRLRSWLGRRDPNTCLPKIKEHALGLKCCGWSLPIPLGNLPSAQSPPPCHGRRGRPVHYNPPMPLPWTDRHFTFNLPEEMFPVVIERLRGTPARIEDKVRNAPA